MYLTIPPFNYLSVHDYLSPNLFVHLENEGGGELIHKTNLQNDTSIMRDFNDGLDSSQSFTDIFQLVKRIVYDFLGIGRRGLRIYQTELPFRLGAFHPVGSKRIIINRRLMKEAYNHSENIREYNSFTFSILLHEYLHSLGYIKEHIVRRLVVLLSHYAFGGQHPATEFAERGPWSLFRNEEGVKNLNAECQGNYWIFGH